MRPEAAERREDGEFVDLGWRPIFKEHTNSRDFDEPVTFDRSAMVQISERCNQRITDDNDFVPIVVRHTKEYGSNDPEVVGLAGPFKAQKLRSGLWGIYAKWRLYKQDADKSRKYPRVSVEYWANKSNLKNGYFDPISLLGSETPELDLGIHYQADPRDEDKQLVRYSKVYRYQAAAPGGANTFVPGGTEEEPKRYQSGGSLSQADLQQIIAAIAPTIKEAVDAAVSAMNPAGADPDHLLTPESEDAEGLGPDGIEGTGDEAVPPEHSDMGPNAEEMTFEAPDDDDDDSDLDVPGGDDDTDPDIDESPGDGPKPKKKPAQYSADGRDSETIFFQEPEMADTNTAEVARYQKEAADYRKKHDDLLTKYQKVETENTTLKTELQALGAEKAKAVRYQKLSAVQADGYTFDIDTEIKDCEELNDAQFDRHVEKIKAHYQRVPGTLASTGLKVVGPARTVKDDRNDAAKRARYAKLAGDNVMKARKGGQTLTYKAEFERLLVEDPEKVLA